MSVSLSTSLSKRLMMMNVDGGDPGKSPAKDAAYLPPCPGHYNFFFFNGCFHWLEASGSRINSFNMAIEVFLNIPFPEDKGGPESGEVTADPFSWDDCLAIVLYTAPSDDRVNQFFDIWVTKEYGVKESWIKLYHIGPLSNILYVVPPFKTDAFHFTMVTGGMVRISAPNILTPYGLRDTMNFIILAD